MRILFVDIDTLRPDHLGCYGYHRNTSPNVDRIAALGCALKTATCPTRPACLHAPGCGVCEPAFTLA